MWHNIPFGGCSKLSSRLCDLGHTNTLLVDAVDVFDTWKIGGQLHRILYSRKRRYEINVYALCEHELVSLAM
jgi:hypothetical protein